MQVTNLTIRELYLALHGIPGSAPGLFYYPSDVDFKLLYAATKIKRGVINHWDDMEELRKNKVAELISKDGDGKELRNERGEAIFTEENQKTWDRFWKDLMEAECTLEVHTIPQHCITKDYKPGLIPNLSTLLEILIEE